jgi:hypothetical protein
MFGDGDNLTHIADLPLLDYNTWDISRTTLALNARVRHGSLQ